MSAPYCFPSCSEIVVFPTRIFERDRSGHDFERRAGLVGVGDGPVAPRVGGVAAVLVRIEGGRRRHREDLAVRGIEQDEDARTRLGLGNRRGQLALSRELNSGVERDEEGIAFLGELARRSLGFAVGRAARVGQGDDLARLSPDCPVVEVLETSQAAVVGSDVAEHVCRQAPLRVDAPGLGDEVDSGDLPGSHAGRGGAVHFSREPDEPLLLGESRDDCFRSHSEMRREKARGLRGMLHLVGNRIDRGRLGGNRQRPALAVEDRAALRRNLDSSLLLPLRSRAVPVPVRQLKLGESRDHDRSPEQEKHDEETDAGETHEVHRAPPSFRGSTY